MATPDAYIQLSSLPEDIRKQVLDYIEFLMERRAREPELSKTGGVPGLAKGRIHIADDFDAPLDDFKDYM